MRKSELPNYDFLGAVYKNTCPNELRDSLESIRSQTIKPKNVVIVIDGFIKEEVFKVLKEYKKKIPIITLTSKKNMGLGLALRLGLAKCKSKVVLRFDTDDINFKERAYLSLIEMNKSNIDILGSNIYEFTDNPNKYISIKKMPLNHWQIKRALFFRNPMNHPSIAFLRESIINLDGGYRDFPFYEDYDLWIRAIFSGLKFKNLDKQLVAMRVSNRSQRRIGIRLILMEFKLFLTFLEYSKFHAFLFFPIFIIRSILKILPLRIFNFILLSLFRKKLK